MGGDAGSGQGLLSIAELVPRRDKLRYRNLRIGRPTAANPSDSVRPARGSSDIKTTPRPYLLLAVVLLGAVLRLSALDLMEFKNDEVAGIVLARRAIRSGLGREGLAGMMSGAGIRNPPGFLYLLSPVAVFTASPLPYAYWVALFGAASVFILFLLGRELGAPAAGFWSAAFLAAHPWHILYSRKIWAQSLLPFFALLLLLALARAERSARSRAAFWIGLLASLIWQVHYSGYCVLFVCAVWLAATAFRRRLNYPWAALGVAAGALLLLPYALYLRGSGGEDLLRSFRGPWLGGPAAAEKLGTILRSFAATAFSGGFGYPFTSVLSPLAATPLGKGSAWISPVASAAPFLILALAAAAIPALLRRRAAPALARFVPWLLLFVLAPPCLYFIRGIEAPPHYFLVSFSALLFLAGVGMETLLSSAAARGSTSGGKGEQGLRGHLPGSGAALLGMLVVFAGVNIWKAFLGEIGRTGGTGGDYGLSYRVQERVAGALREERAGEVDALLMRDEGVGVRYLLELRRTGPPPAPSVRARLIDGLLFPGRECSPYRGETVQRRIGPVTICLSGPSVRP